MLQWAKLNCGIVIYVIKQIILKANQNFSILKHIKIKKNMVLLLKNMNLLKQNLMTWVMYSNDTFTDCGNKYFPSSEYRCIYEIKFIYMESNEEGILSITLG